jgi:hypothetical protein
MPGGSFVLYNHGPTAMTVGTAEALLAGDAWLVHPDMLPGDAFEVSGYYVGASDATLRVRFDPADAGVGGSLVLAIPLAANQGLFSASAIWKPAEHSYVKVTGQLATAVSGCTVAGLLVSWSERPPLVIPRPERPRDLNEFGVDLDVLTDLPPSFALASGWRNLGNAIARRLSTPAGALARIGDDPDYGFDLRGLLNADVSVQDVAILGPRIEHEVEKDDRVLQAAVASVFTWQEYSLAVSIDVLTASGPFRLILGVGQLSVDVINERLAA